MDGDKVAIMFTGGVALFFVLAFAMAFREPIMASWRQRQARKRKRPRTGDFFL